MSIGSFVKGAVKGFVLSGGNPVGAIAGSTAELSADRQRRIARRQQEQYNKFIKEQQNMVMGSGEFGTPGISFSSTRPTTQNAGFGAGFGEFLTDVGRNIVSPFAGLASQIAPFFGRSVQQQPAVTTTRNIGGQETQGSGSIQAGVGSLIQPALQVGRQFLKSPVGQIGVGTGVGSLLGGAMTGQPTGMRITRKMKSQARMVLNLAGGNISIAADMLGISEEMLIQVLLKRFRNDGPVVTKAALRKTKQTVRRLKSMCDMYDSLRPRAAARRSPVRRSTSTTLIKN